MSELEILSLRQENSKTFDIGNGKRRLEVSMGQIHYKDDYVSLSESWKDIDLTWIGNQITKAPFTLILEGNKVTIWDKKTGEISTIELTNIGGKPVATQTLGKSAGLASVSNVVLDTDLEIMVENGRVKFSRVLKSDKAPLNAQFKVTGNFIIKAQDSDGDLPVETTLKDGILTETLKPDRLVKYPVRIDPTWQVGASTDDCFLFYLSPSWQGWSITNTHMRTGYFFNGQAGYGGGMRFQNVTIPKGATISSASLLLTCDVEYDATVVRTQITGQNDDNPETFSTLADYETRRGTVVGGVDNSHITSSINWDNIPYVAVDNTYSPPDISSIIQAIINRSGWESGNAMVIFWDDHALRSNSGSNYICRSSYSYNGSTTKAPKLIVIYFINTTVVPDTIKLNLEFKIPRMILVVTPEVCRLLMTLFESSVYGAFITIGVSGRYGIKVESNWTNPVPMGGRYG